MSVGLSIVLYVVGLFIMYIIIEAAVRKGINDSIVGKHFAEKQGIEENKKTFLNNDLDAD